MRSLYLYGLLFAGLLTGSALAEELAPVGIVTRLESGFVSNATDSPIGQGDLYVGTTAVLTLGGIAEGVELRGALTLSDLRFARQDFENDQGVTLELGIGKQLSETLALRGSFSIAGTQSGDDLSVAGLYLATETPSTAVSMQAEAIYQTKTQLLRWSLLYGRQDYGDTRFPGLPFDAVRLNADTRNLQASLGSRTSLAEGLTLLGDAALQTVAISAADQLAYGRLPLDKAEASIGLEASLATRLQVSANLGLSTLWSQDFAALRRTVPIASVSANLVLTDAVVLNLGIARSIALLDARDGLATQNDSVSAKLSAALDPQTGFVVGLSSVRQGGVYVPAVAAVETIASLGMQRRFGTANSLELTLSATDHDEVGNSYAKTQLALALSLAM